MDALDWLARVVTHIPNKGEHLVRYTGAYSNRARGEAKKRGMDNLVPTVTDNDISGKTFRKNWARLIQKIYEVDPLICPNCMKSMKIIAFIEKPKIIEKILKHLGLWENRNHDPPDDPSSYVPELTYDDSFSQELPFDYWLQ